MKKFYYLSAITFCLLVGTVNFTMSQTGCDLNLIRQTFSNAGCTELSGCLSSCSIYFYNPISQTGDDAQLWAQNYGANLISVQSTAENDCIINELNANGFGGTIWIGLNDVANEGTFVWYDQNPVTFTNWSGGQPDNFLNEDCIQIYPNGTWNDFPCNSSGSKSVIEVSLCPTTTITPAITTICLGDSVSLPATTILGSFPYNYSWTSIPAGFTSAVASPKVAPSLTTTYNVTATDRFGCLSQSTVTINVMTPSVPVITSGGPTTFCPGGNVVLTSDNATTYNWNNGATSQSTTITSAGIFTVSVVDANGCTATSLPITTSLYPLPTVSVTPPAPVTCPGSPVNLTASGAKTYVWSPATGLNTITGNSVSASPFLTTTYTVTGTDSLGCVNTAFTTLTMISKPIVAIKKPVNPLCDSAKLDWASWTTVSDTSIAGTISSGLSVLVTKPSGGLSTTADMFNGGVFPSQYTVPVNNTAIKNDMAGLFTFCFNKPVLNPQIALSSIGNFTQTVQVNTSSPYEVIWQGFNMSYPTNTAFIGTEGFTIIKFPGIFTCLSFDYLQSESYCNLAFGALDSNCQAVASPPICAGSPDTLIASGAINYTWFPTTGLNASTGATVIAIPLVTTKYYVIGTDVNNCSGIDSVIVAVNPLPTATLTGDTIICAGDSTTLTASGGATYLWLPGNSADSITTVVPTSTDTYTVIVTNTGGCKDSSSIHLSINQLPVISVPPSAPVCSGSSLNLTASGAKTYLWFPATGLSATTGISVSASPPSTTTYTITGTDSLGCFNTATSTVTINPKPMVAITKPVNPLCDSAKLDWASWTSVSDTSIAGTISSDLSVLVTKPSGGLSTTADMFNGGVFPSQYTVPVNNTAIKNDLAGLFTFCFNKPVLNPQIALSSIGNPGNSVQVNTSSPYEVIWQGLNMSYPTNTAFIGTEGFTIIKFPGIHTCISFDYLQSESYCNLAFGALDSNCQAVASPPICSGTPDTLIASGALTYSWFPTTGLNASTGSVVVATPLVTTKYYVIGSDANNCSGIDSILISVNPLPTATLTGDTIICAGDSTTLTASGGVTYLWTPGNSIDSVLTISPTQTTIYTVSITNANGCKDSSSINLIVNPLPQALFNLNPVCKNDPVIYTDASIGNILDWNWNYGDGGASSLQNPSHIYSTCDTFNVKLAVTTTAGCKDSITKTARVYCLPVADFSFTEGCLNQVTNFTDLSTFSGGTITGWLWDFGDGSLPNTIQNPSHTYLVAGSYIVTLIATTNNGCTDTVTKNMKVHPLPDVQFRAGNVCDGNNVQFIDLSSIASPDIAQSWSWNFGDGSTLNTSQNTSHLYTGAGSYTVQLLIVSSFGCKDSLSKAVVVNPNPVVNFSVSDTLGCEPLCDNFQNTSTIATGTIVQWLWNFGIGSAASIVQNPQNCFTNDSVFSPISYSISLMATSDSGCVSTLIKNNYITVYPNPIASFTVQPETASINNPVVSTTDLSVGANFWDWNFGDLDSSSISNPLPHTYADTGTYLVTLTVFNQHGCMDVDYHSIIIEPDFLFYIPNAFSPNNDGVNDSFSPKGVFFKDFEMSIFDRWGNLIYIANDINQSWDGKVNHGKEIAQRDVYLYVITLTDIKKKSHTYKGVVTLIR